MRRIGLAEEVTEFYKRIGIGDVDRAIRDWFDRVVDAHVVGPNEQRLKVPVVVMAGERWLTGKERRGIRDEHGRLVLPLIGIRRTSIDPVNGLAALGTNVPRLQVSRKLSSKTNELRNLIEDRPLGARRLSETDVYEVTTIPFPFSGIAMYELVIQSQFHLQMNAILEKIFSQLEYYEVPCFVATIRDTRAQALPNDRTTEFVPAEDSPYDDRKPLDDYYVVGYFEPGMNESGNLDEFTDQERIVKYTTSFRVPIYLHLDPEGKMSAIRVERTAFKLGFRDEHVVFVEDPDELDAIFGRR